MIFLSAVTAFVLARDIARGERQKIHLATVAQARLTSLSDAQHQLKNQIASISRPLMTAMRGVERGAPIGFVKDKLATAIRESEELQQTLDIMLNAARLEADRPLDIGWKASVDLAALLEMLCSKRASLASTSGGERYRIEVTIPSVRVFVHEAALKQVLNNIIDNAFKYSPDESLIEVQATVQEPVQMLYIRIRDGGVGISPEDQERIFNEPFYRGSADSRETPGTGLGLNLARRYVEAMHGTVQVESRGAGTGSTFVIALPYEPDKTPPSLAMERK
jgi:two-component system sensor histidine kinase KdpD